MPEDESEVSRFAGVVEARPAVRNPDGRVVQPPGAGAEVQRNASPTPVSRERQESLDVRRERAPLEAVEYEQPRRAGGAIDVVEQELVSVRRLQGFPAGGHLSPGAGQ